MRPPAIRVQDPLLPVADVHTPTDALSGFRPETAAKILDPVLSMRISVEPRSELVVVGVLKIVFHVLPPSVDLTIR